MNFFQRIARTARKRLTRPYAPIYFEPVFGCEFNCPQCELEAPPCPPFKKRFISLDEADAAITELENKRLLKRVRIVLTGAGNPIDHPRITELIRLIRLRVPKSQINLSWNLGTVKNEAELVEKTRGINKLGLSLDAHHQAGLLKQLKNELPAENRGQFVREKMKERIQWALRAALKNDFNLFLNYVGKQKEYNAMMSLTMEAFNEAKAKLTKKELKNLRKKLRLEDISFVARAKRGSGLDRVVDPKISMVLADGTVLPGGSTYDPRYRRVQ